MIATSPPEIRNGSLNGIWRWVRTTRSMGSVFVMGISSVRDGHGRSEARPPRTGRTIPGSRRIGPTGPGEGRDAGPNVQILISHSLETREVATAPVVPLDVGVASTPRLGSGRTDGPSMSVPQRKSPWYRDGLAFTCTRCGDCCTGSPGLRLGDDRGDARGSPNSEGRRVESFAERFVRLVGDRFSLIEKPGGDCIFWDKQAGCTVYDARPVQCRTWPFWPENIATAGRPGSTSARSAPGRARAGSTRSPRSRHPLAMVHK